VVVQHPTRSGPERVADLRPRLSGHTLHGVTSKGEIMDIQSFSAAIFIHLAR
jgi:hypothetical protein